MNTRPSPRARTWLLLSLVFGYAVLAGGYFVLRYTGRWTDPDTVNLSLAARGMLQDGSLVSEDIYAMGFGYPSLIVTISDVTGLSLTQLQLVVNPLVAACLVALLAFVTYRELTGELTAAALGVLLLFMQPDFLFVIFRGSHEKLTWSMALLVLFFLAKSLRAARAQRLGHFAIWVVFFYLAVYGLVASNAFFGSSFILAAGVSLLGGLVILLRTANRAEPSQASRAAITRLVYVLIIAMVIWVLHIFYLFPPAVSFLTNLSRVAYRTRAVTLGEVPSTNPYATVAYGWVSRKAYLALVIPTFTIAGLSFVAWALLGISYWRGRKRPAVDPMAFLAWLLYGGFGLQIAASVLLAASGGAATNLQLRLMPVMMLFGVPLVTKGLTELWKARVARRGGRLLAVATALFVLWMSGASLLKATNDPSLGNYWMFRLREETVARQWVDEHLQGSVVWLGLDGARLDLLIGLDDLSVQDTNFANMGEVYEVTRHVVISEVDAQLAVRRRQPLPEVHRENLVYDNGEVVQYHILPQTPYQR